MTRPSSVLSRTGRRVRFPRRRSLQSVFAYLKRACPAEPQPVKQYDDGVTFLRELGLSFVWTGRDWGLQCRGCNLVYVRSGHAAKHQCPSGPLGATSSELAKERRSPLEGRSVPDRMSRDLPE